MKKPLFKRKWFIALVIILALALIGGCMGGEDESTADPAATEATQVEETTEATEATEAVSQEFKNALSSADTYANMMNMSKDAIYDQLISEYGDQFPEDAAQYAVDNVQADWNANALAAAKIYYTDMSMSKNEIYDQLISQYGDQFTKDQAQYAVDHLDD